MSKITQHSIPSNFLTRNVHEISLIAKLCLLKKAFPRGIIYDYSAANTSSLNRIPLSKNTISRTISKLIERGWAEMKGQHLVLAPWWELENKRSNKNPYWSLKFKSDGSLKDITRRLRLEMLKVKQRQQCYVLKLVNQKTSRLPFDEQPAEILKASYLCFAKTFGVSQTRAFQIIDDLVQNRLLYKRTFLKKLRSMSNTEWRYYRPFRQTGEFFSNGTLYCQEVNRYSIP